MSKVLGIDYGTKRTGIAITDSLQIIASGLTTISTHKLYDFVNELINNEEIECIVVGDPKNLDGGNTNTSQHINIFIKNIKAKYPKIIIKSIDERFTSKIARKTILDSGANRKKRKDKSLVDKVSATIILQSYLDSK